MFVTVRYPAVAKRQDGMECSCRLVGDVAIDNSDPGPKSLIGFAKQAVIAGAADVIILTQPVKDSSSVFS